MQKKKGKWGAKKTTPVEDPKVKDSKKDLKKELRASCEKDGTYLTMKKVEVVGTGSLILNRIIGDGTLCGKPGGFPRGGVTEIFGDESTGKSTLALLGVKEALDAGECAVWADFEHTLRLQRTYIENLGINFNSPNFFGIIPMDFESGAEKIGKAMVAYHPAIIVIDSVTAMIPQAGEDSEDPSKMVQIGKHAKLTSQFLNWITKRLDKYNTALVLLNQTRIDIKISSMPGRHGGPKEISSGGQAPKFFTTVRIQLKQGEKETVSGKSSLTGLDEKKASNQVVKAICVKNKFDIAYKTGPIYFATGKGVDNIMSLVYLGENLGVFKKGGGGYYSWKDPNNDKVFFNIQGKVALVKYLEANPGVLEAAMPYLIPSTSAEAMMERKRELEAINEKELSKEDKDELTSLREKLKDKIIDDESVEVEVDSKLEIAEVSEDGQSDLDELKSITSGEEE